MAVLLLKCVGVLGSCFKFFGNTAARGCHFVASEMAGEQGENMEQGQVVGQQVAQDLEVVKRDVQMMKLYADQIKFIQKEQEGQRRLARKAAIRFECDKYSNKVRGLLVVRVVPCRL